eukprot:scaffold3505_cov385-Prasinococcus_capsulatus_cf.AAC.14
MTRRAAPPAPGGHAAPREEEAPREAGGAPPRGARGGPFGGEGGRCGRRGLHSRVDGTHSRLARFRSNAGANRPARVRGRLTPRPPKRRSLASPP